MTLVEQLQYQATRLKKAGGSKKEEPKKEEEEKKEEPPAQPEKRLEDMTL